MGCYPMIITDQMALDAYYGTGGFATGAYLIQHAQELDDDFAARKSVASYRNVLRLVVEAYLGTLFATPATRSGDAPTWAALQRDADGASGKLDDVMERATLLSLLLGTAYLVIDRPPGESRTRADDLARLPYIVLRQPADVASMALDRRGVLTRVVFREAATAAEFGAGASAPELVYRGWDQQRWWVSKDALGEQVLTGDDGNALTAEHGLGLVPVVRLHSTLQLEPQAERAVAWARPLIDIALDGFNRHSEARAIERDQTVSTLALPVGDQQERERIREQGLTIGARNAVMYDPAGGAKPGYFAPPADPLKLLYEAVSETREDMYRQAHLEFAGAVNSSGVALSYQLLMLNRTLAGMARRIEEAEQRCGEIGCLWMGETADDLSTSYPQEFDIDDLLARLDEASQALALDPGPTAARRIKGRAVRQVLGDTATAEDYAEIDAELEAAALGQTDPYGDRVAMAGGREV